ncbi:hypothetical protein BCR33DRAFT_717540, partial [Rhizoclosmatium globosum]
MFAGCYSQLTIAASVVSKDMTPDTCQETCSQFKAAMLFIAPLSLSSTLYQCACSMNALPVTSGDDKCNRPCLADPSSSCGDTTLNETIWSAYYIAPPIEKSNFIPYSSRDISVQPSQPQQINWNLVGAGILPIAVVAFGAVGMMIMRQRSLQQRQNAAAAQRHRDPIYSQSNQDVPHAPPVPVLDSQTEDTTGKVTMPSPTLVGMTLIGDATKRDSAHLPFHYVETPSSTPTAFTLRGSNPLHTAESMNMNHPPSTSSHIHQPFGHEYTESATLHRQRSIKQMARTVSNLFGIEINQDRLRGRTQSLSQGSQHSHSGFLASSSNSGIAAGVSEESFVESGMSVDVALKRPIIVLPPSDDTDSLTSDSQSVAVKEREGCVSPSPSSLYMHLLVENRTF